MSQILRNEKYIGDALLQKTYTVDFLPISGSRTTALVPQYYVENSHEAIIPRETFMQAQEELVRRRIVHTSPNGKNRVFGSRNCQSHIVFFGTCGESYRRITGITEGKSLLSGDASAQRNSAVAETPGTSTAKAPAYPLEDVPANQKTRLILDYKSLDGRYVLGACKSLDYAERSFRQKKLSKHSPDVSSY